MEKERKQILNTAQITQKIKRIAFEMYEQNHNVKELVIAGIDDMGLKLSELIKAEVEKISDIYCHLVRIDIDKEATSQPLVEHSQLPDISNFTLVIVDDVLNSGKTMVHAFDPFLKLDVRKIQTAVLVNRSHKRFPIAVDYKGLELATTIQEHIEVELTNNEFAAYLY
ncbi:MAG: phosphoribosyltransferase [Roseivirga sp.]|nr:phosphoribosyltransferase [Roseivirga sp.]